MRMGWNWTGDVQHQTAESVIGINAGAWNLHEVGVAYNAMTAPVQNNALFNGRFPGQQNLMWHATLTSGTDNADGAGRNGMSADFVQEGMLHEVGMGLLGLSITHSTPAAHQGAVEDDYQWWVSFDFEVMD